MHAQKNSDSSHITVELVSLFYLQFLFCPHCPSPREYASELGLVLPLEGRVVDAEPALVGNLQVQLLPPVVHAQI